MKNIYEKGALHDQVRHTTTPKCSAKLSLFLFISTKNTNFNGVLANGVSQIATLINEHKTKLSKLIKQHIIYKCSNERTNYYTNKFLHLGVICILFLEKLTS